MLIKDLVVGVREKLRGRDDFDDRIPIWIKETILDLTMSYPFEDLGVKGPLSNFVPSQSEYDINFFLEGLGKPFTRILSWFVFYTPDGTVIPGSSTGFNIKGRALQVVEPMSVIPGIPCLYAQNGRTLLVGFMPNVAYATYMRVQIVHPFIENNLLQTEVRMPVDWKDIIEYAAAIKGCDAVGMTEVGNGYLQKLHGDPKEPGNIGLIQARQSQQRRNLTNNERQLQPVVRRFT
jgi:hypothetical protein